MIINAVNFNVCLFDMLRDKWVVVMIESVPACNNRNAPEILDNQSFKINNKSIGKIWYSNQNRMYMLSTISNDHDQRHVNLTAKNIAQCRYTFHVELANEEEIKKAEEIRNNRSWFNW